MKNEGEEKIQKIDEDLLTRKIIGCCYEVHNKLGPGFMEKIYAAALRIKLKEAGLEFEVKKQYNVFFESCVIGRFRCDLLVADAVIVEIKSVTGVQPKLFQCQLISYLKASSIKIGLIVNFGNPSCEIKRLSV